MVYYKKLDVGKLFLIIKNLYANQILKIIIKLIIRLVFITQTRMWIIIIFFLKT